MHGVTGKPPGAAKDNTGNATSRVTLLLLVAMTGVAPISLYMLVPALPVLAATFGRDISIAQMTVSLYMVGIACSQIIMGPLSDRFGRRPVLLAGLGLMVVASVGCLLAETLPQLIAARFLQALGGATGMVVSRAIIRDLYPRERVGAMISLVIAVMMIAQMLSPLTGGLLEIAFGWRAIFYAITAASILVATSIALALPETRRDRTEDGGFRGDVGNLITSRAFIGYVLCQVLASQIAAPSSAMCCARCWPRRSFSSSPAADPISWSRRWGAPAPNTARGSPPPGSPFWSATCAACASRRDIRWRN
jgi:MFS transporter, DHA1 family, multidrug resistance protein